MQTLRPPNRFSSFARGLLALALGLLVGVFCHYMIYRLSLPSSPFIYVAF